MTEDINMITKVTGYPTAYVRNDILGYRKEKAEQKYT